MVDDCEWHKADVFKLLRAMDAYRETLGTPRKKPAPVLSEEALRKRTAFMEEQRRLLNVQIGQCYMHGPLSGWARRRFAQRDVAFGLGG